MTEHDELRVIQIFKKNILSTKGFSVEILK
jgi:hypothetical protein